MSLSLICTGPGSTAGKTECCVLLGILAYHAYLGPLTTFYSHKQTSAAIILSALMDLIHGPPEM